MKPETSFFFIICAFSVILFGDSHSISKDDEYPSKSILSNLMKDNSKGSYISRFIDLNEPISLDKENCLNQFLNRFQPAMDRDVNKGDENAPHSKESVSIYQKPTSMKTSSKTDTLMAKIWGLKGEMNSSDSTDKNVVKRSIVLDPQSTQVCTKVPGKVLCKFGRFTYVINTKDKDLDAESLEKIVGMVHQRVCEGDKSFDLSITETCDHSEDSQLRDNVEFPIHSVIKQTHFSMDGLENGKDKSPVMVECSPVKRETFKSAKDTFNSYSIETTYNCKWHSLKIKREISNRTTQLTQISQRKKNTSQEVNTEKVIVSAVKAKLCTTPLNVRQYSDECPSTGFEWCPTSTFKPCPTSNFPICVPWCNPFLIGNKEKEMSQIEPQQENLDSVLYNFQLLTDETNLMSPYMKSKLYSNPEMENYIQPVESRIALKPSIKAGINTEFSSFVEGAKSINIRATNPEEANSNTSGKRLIPNKEGLSNTLENANMTEIVNKPIGNINIPSNQWISSIPKNLLAYKDANSFKTSNEIRLAPSKEGNMVEQKLQKRI